MSQANARLVYKNALAAIKRAGADPQKAILSQSFLRLEQAVATNKTQYQFGVLVNDSQTGLQYPTETRLNLQDAFYVANIDVFTTNSANANDSNVKPITWPNPWVYTTANAADALWNLYNGYFSLTVNNRVITPSWDVMRHLEIPQTQQNNAPGAGINADERHGNRLANGICEPNWVLIGSKNNQFVLNLPAAIGTLQVASTTKIVVLMRGILAQNVTPVV